ncbi:hypothetical protein LXL04_039050 [Taraxacum kok-saghyz]
MLQPPSTNRWQQKIPKKDNIFLRRVIRGRLPVRKVLLNLVANIPDTKCPLCTEPEETIPHIFLKCTIAQFSWLRLGLWWKMAIPDFNTMEDVWEWLDNCKIQGKFKKHLWVVIIAILKSIWETRNNKVFNEKEKTKEMVFEGAQAKAFN